MKMPRGGKKVEKVEVIAAIFLMMLCISLEVKWFI